MELTPMKGKMLEVVEGTHQNVLNLVSGLSEEEKQAKGNLQRWSAKDLLIHLNFWGKHFLTQMDNSLKGERVPLAGDYYNQVNDGVLYENMDKPFEEAFKEYQEVYPALVKKLQEFSEEDLQDKERFTWLEGRTMIDRVIGNLCWHAESHIADFLVKKGQLEEATRLQEALTEKIKVFPIWNATAVYNLGCFYALNGMSVKAIACLKESFQNRPDLLDWSKKDSDLDSLRELPEFQELYP